MDPTIGRWLTEDPEGFTAKDMDLYRYCENDPTNLTDPSGCEPTIKGDPVGTYIVPGTNDKGKVEVWQDATATFDGTTESHMFALRYSGPDANKVDFVQLIAMYVSVQRSTGPNNPLSQSYENGDTVSSSGTRIVWSQSSETLLWTVDNPKTTARDPRVIACKIPWTFRDEKIAAFADQPGVASGAVKETVTKYYFKRKGTTPLDTTVVAVSARSDFKTFILLDNKVVGVVLWNSSAHWVKPATETDVDLSKVKPTDTIRVQLGPAPDYNVVAPRPNDKELKEGNDIIANSVVVANPNAPRSSDRKVFDNGPYLK